MLLGTRVRGAGFKCCLRCVTLAESRTCSLFLQKEGLVPAFPAVGKS